MSWILYSHKFSDGSTRYSGVPDEDSGAHRPWDDCECKPWFSETGVLIHRAYDGREAWEYLASLKEAK